MHWLVSVSSPGQRLRQSDRSHVLIHDGARATYPQMTRRALFTLESTVFGGFLQMCVRFVDARDENRPTPIRLIEVPATDTTNGYIDEKCVDEEARTGYVEARFAGIQ
jgi:hypothetical protein